MLDFSIKFSFSASNCIFSLSDLLISEPTLDGSDARGLGGPWNFQRCNECSAAKRLIGPVYHREIPGAHYGALVAVRRDSGCLGFVRSSVRFVALSSFFSFQAIFHLFNCFRQSSIF